MADDSLKESRSPSRRAVLAMLAGGGVLGASAGYIVSHASPGTRHAPTSNTGKTSSVPGGPDPNLAKKTTYFCSGDSKIYAVNAVTSALRWSREIRADSAMSPTLFGRSVYVGGGDRNVHALDASTGAVKWTFATGLPVSSSPAVVDGTVYIGSADATFYALDAASGSLKWRHRTSSGIDSTPVVVGDTVYFAGGDMNLYALDARTGNVRWSKQVFPFVGWYSELAASNGLLYAAIGSGNKIAAFDVTTGALRWSSVGAANTPPAIDNGMLYVSTDPLVYALDPLTGRTRWSHKPEAGIISWSPVAAAGRTVYVGFAQPHGGGGVRALDSMSGRVLWTQLTDGNVDIGGPQVIYGVVYVGSDNYLFALDAMKGTPIWSYRTGDRVQARPAVG